MNSIYIEYRYDNGERRVKAFDLKTNNLIKELPTVYPELEIFQSVTINGEYYFVTNIDRFHCRSDKHPYTIIKLVLKREYISRLLIKGE